MKMASPGLKRSVRFERQTKSVQTKRAPCSGSAPRPRIRALPLQAVVDGRVVELLEFLKVEHAVVVGVILDEHLGRKFLSIRLEPIQQP